MSLNIINVTNVTDYKSRSSSDTSETFKSLHERGCRQVLNTRHILAGCRRTAERCEHDLLLCRFRPSSIDHAWRSHPTTGSWVRLSETSHGLSSLTSEANWRTWSDQRYEHAESHSTSALWQCERESYFAQNHHCQLERQ